MCPCGWRSARRLLFSEGYFPIFLGCDHVEVNPILDERNGTAELSVELIASLMGRQIIDLPH